VNGDFADAKCKTQSLTVLATSLNRFHSQLQSQSESHAHSLKRQLKTLHIRPVCTLVVCYSPLRVSHLPIPFSIFHFSLLLDWMQPSVMQLLKGLYRVISLLICVVWVVICVVLCWAVCLIWHHPDPDSDPGKGPSSPSSSLEQVAFPPPAGAGAVPVAIVATEALEILVARTAVMRVRVRMRVVVAVAGAVVQTVRVAAAVAHLFAECRSLTLLLWNLESGVRPLESSGFARCVPAPWLAVAQLISGQRFVFRLGLG